MNTKWAGGDNYQPQYITVARGIKLARSDERIVALTYLWTDDHGLEDVQGLGIKFLTHLEGEASPESQSWALFIREDLLVSQWSVGSHLQIGNSIVNVPGPSLGT